MFWLHKFLNQNRREMMGTAKHFHDITPAERRYDVLIEAKTYAPENPLDEIFPDVKPTEPREDGITDRTKGLMYSKMKMPAGVGLAIGPSPDLWRSGPQAYFTEEIAVPVLHYRGGHLSGWNTWMSLTPMEIWTQSSGIIAATGNVVLGGLGMGWLLRQIVKKPTVKSVVVVEKDKRLLNWFGKKLCKQTPKVQEVICADIYDVAHKFDLKRTKFILDIWESDGRAGHDPKLQKLRDDGGRVWAWGSPRDPAPLAQRRHPSALVERVRRRITAETARRTG